MSDFIPDFNMASEKIQSPVRYPSDLIDEEWEILEPILDELEPYTTGRPRTTDLREILNAIFYLNKTGCPWRYLPKDFPFYTLVNYYYNKWTDNGTLGKVNAVLRQRLREKKGQNPDPTGTIIRQPKCQGHPGIVCGIGVRRGQARQGQKAPYRCRYNRLLARCLGARSQRIRRQSRISSDREAVFAAP